MAYQQHRSLGDGVHLICVGRALHEALLGLGSTDFKPILSHFEPFQAISSQLSRPPTGVGLV